MGLDACIQTEDKQKQSSKLLGIKRKLAEESPCSEEKCHADGKWFSKAEKSKNIGERKAFTSKRRVKARELLMQHDPVGLALKIPQDRRVAAVCLITW